ncbi:hypothetical protein BJF83_07830 [Nocardiopsis sp. CNR-923]|uniref:DUF6879 family protein n=1 Tax=Nocardiopsis sp. CNR-923 TaxID=1904965 RepID=UPI00095C3F72|nr:DUF6879 family protein [Nocardiopsis sp. CNR-923]OLT30617.1 hypothetical protein BJF83_07830 [Nocardiopsis sp. CNR-923]
MTQNAPDFVDMLDACRESAVHLEMRDIYGMDDEMEGFERWKREGRREDWDDRDSWWHPFYQAIANATARGVLVRRARVVSTPVTEYIRYEHEGTQGNIIAGEHVRWLPRRQATDIAFPGNDFWLFDDRIVRINHFSGDGQMIDEEVTEAPEVAKLCSSAFEAVWERAIPHDDFRI